MLGLRRRPHDLGNILSHRVKIAGLQPADVDHHVQHRRAVPNAFKRFRHLRRGGMASERKSDGNSDADRRPRDRRHGFSRIAGRHKDDDEAMLLGLLAETQNIRPRRLRTQNGMVDQRRQIPLTRGHGIPHSKMGFSYNNFGV